MLELMGWTLQTEHNDVEYTVRLELPIYPCSSNG